MAAHRIAIMSDSTCDLPSALLEELGIVVVPLYVLFGEDHLRDGVDIDTPGFYQRLAADKVHPSTSQPTTADFVRAIEATEAEEVICLHITHRLSGTGISANAAREIVNRKVHVVDSLSVSMGLGFQVMAAARARNAGASVDEILAEIERVRSTLHVVFTVETLEFLHRGGRIGAAAKVLGTALQLKPVLNLAPDGQIDAVERVRSRKKSLLRLPEYVLERLDGSQPLRVGVMHGLAYEDAETVFSQMRQRANVIEEVHTLVGPVVGTHGGPGVLGLAVHVA
ncbi:MAG: DegV family protein [Anaerolineae bacterium]|jgi:DegV family protein with EDD domain|nr:DegV family protein [Chloroflexota bacterium]